MDQAQAIALVNNPNGLGPKVTDNARVNSTQVAAGVTHAVGCASSGQTLYYPDGTTATPGSSGSSGTIAAMLAASPTLGATWIVTDTTRPLEFIGATNPITGNTFYWAPRGGRQNLLTRSGSVATPFATLPIGTTAGAFTLTGLNKIPAGLLLAGVSRLEIRPHFRRAGATAALTLNVRLGTTNSTSDSLVTTLSVTAVSPEARIYTELGVSGATTFTTLLTLIFQTIQAATAVDRSTNFAAASDNFITIDISGANALDGPFSLVSLEVDLVG